ncbi:hypothetical protein [Sphingomonas kyeonggiensis]|uniref:Uncharacterized protein n=1 Tax=Sphingomonas kyeonggiensis TaxID=1268553 RepID=A0A7W6NY93_9SPHN|nr:hypothetical protein [Sphingomonas kyeonggiensis]MBB4100447.1 hypothetical protein [Sphingomonas kyeonggiensis]
MTASQLRDFLVTALVNQNGGSPRRWRIALGPVQLRDPITEADCDLSLARRSPEYGQGDSGKCGDPELYTCTISALVGSQHVQVFAAMIASGHVEVRSRLRRRYGPLLEDEAIVRAGFDWSEPLACAMVSDAMAHVLEMAAEEQSSPIAAGLDFQIEQRFAA